MATITNNASKIITENETNDDDYNLLYSRTIKQYVKEMTEMIENEYGDLTDTEKEKYDWRDTAREIVVNSVEKAEEDFMDTIDEEITAIGMQRVIMKMMKIVMEYNEQFDTDISRYSDIGKLYAMWIYIVTQEVDFEFGN
jgi:hypothetical protein